MTKRIIALFLCIATCLTLVLSMASCGRPDVDTENKGQSVVMYLSDSIYDLDPANAYKNESTANVVSLLFETLFKLDENGKIKKGLAKSYEIIEDEIAEEYKMEITLDDTHWSDGIDVLANDFLYTCHRLLDVEASYESASLLFDIKNARDVKMGECSEDDLGVTADNKIITITFEGKIDYDRFLLNLTSLALAPVREDIANKTDDWAKKPSTMVTSGPFKLSRITFSPENSDVKYKDINWTTKNGTPGDYEKNCSEAKITSFIIERNVYYRRENVEDVKLDKAVTPYRIIVDCSLSDADILKGYRDGTILCVNDIPLSIREDLKDEATVTDSLSTHTYYFNQNAMIKNSSTNKEVALFAIKEVRQALSMAIDREAIAQTVVFAKAAEGIISNGMFAYDSAKKTYREECSNSYEYLKNDISGAKAKLESAGIVPSDYSFSITVAAYDDVHVAIAEAVAAVWGSEGLGFDVKINKRGTVLNNDYYALVDDIPTDMCDDLYAEDLKSGNFEVIALDLCATTPDPFSVLAPFAKEFAGQSMDMSTVDNYVIPTHITGYDSEEYNKKIEDIFAQKDIKERCTMYADAEALLMEDMPAMPIVHNQYATVISDKINLGNKVLFWNTNGNYYSTLEFAKMYINKNDYSDYVSLCNSWVMDNYDYYRLTLDDSAYGADEDTIKTNKKSVSLTYLYQFKDISWDEFSIETSIYDFIFTK